MMVRFLLVEPAYSSLNLRLSVGVCIYLDLFHNLTGTVSHFIRLVFLRIDGFRKERKKE
jgi:hypothetical protein